MLTSARVPAGDGIGVVVGREYIIFRFGEHDIHGKLLDIMVV